MMVMMGTILCSSYSSRAPCRVDCSCSWLLSFRTCADTTPAALRMWQSILCTCLHCRRRHNLHALFHLSAATSAGIGGCDASGIRIPHYLFGAPNLLPGSRLQNIVSCAHKQAGLLLNYVSHGEHPICCGVAAASIDRRPHRLVPSELLHAACAVLAAGCNHVRQGSAWRLWRERHLLRGVPLALRGRLMGTGASEMECCACMHVYEYCSCHMVMCCTLVCVLYVCYG